MRHAGSPGAIPFSRRGRREKKRKKAEEEAFGGDYMD
jgi:hypothetical protein